VICIVSVGKDFTFHAGVDFIPRGKEGFYILGFCIPAHGNSKCAAGGYLGFVHGFEDMGGLHFSAGAGGAV